jgi:hypothetical protein
VATRKDDITGSKKMVKKMFTLIDIEINKNVPASERVLSWLGEDGGNLEEQYQ